MEEYIVENAQACLMPSPFVIKEVENNVKFKSCNIVKCWGISLEISPVYISLNAGSIVLSDLNGENSCSEFGIEFLHVLTKNKLLPIQLNRTKFCLCFQKNQATVTKSSVIEGELIANEINGTHNKADYDSVFGLLSASEGNLMTNLIFRECDSSVQTGIFFNAKHASVYNMDFINNTQRANNMYGMIDTYDGNLDVTHSNIICSSPGFLFAGRGTGMLTVSDCFITSSWTNTNGNCHIKNTAVEAFEIYIKNPNMQRCDNQGTLVNRIANIACLFAIQFQS